MNSIKIINLKELKMKKLFDQDILNSITITTSNPVPININYKVKLDEIIEELKKTEQSVEAPDTFNMYKNVLDFWYYKMFSSVKHFQKTMRVSSVMSSQAFTEELRTVSFNLGRQSGASTAIVKFIEEHPDLNIKIMCPLYNIQLELERKFRTKDASNYFNLKEVSVDDVDVVFIDPTSCFKFKPEQLDFLSRLNSNHNKNQWIIKLG